MFRLPTEFLQLWTNERERRKTTEKSGKNYFVSFIGLEFNFASFFRAWVIRLLNHCTLFDTSVPTVSHKHAHSSDPSCSYSFLLVVWKCCTRYTSRGPGTFFNLTAGNPERMRVHKALVVEWVTLKKSSCWCRNHWLYCYTLEHTQRVAW
jgi:hypothetical protein